MIGIERIDGLRPPSLADEYGPALLLPAYARCEGGSRGDIISVRNGRPQRCQRRVGYGLGAPRDGEAIGIAGAGIWAWACRQHARQYRGPIIAL